jgi:beta-1,4-mannosyltransferase
VPRSHVASTPDHPRLSGPVPLKPGSPAALVRAAALERYAVTLPAHLRVTESVVVAYLRGELGPAVATRTATPADLARCAAKGAALLRARGVDQPTVVITFPGFDPNPFGRMMEQAYEPAGLVPVHVRGIDDIEAVISGRTPGGYRVILHLNGPDRFVKDGATDVDAAALADGALARLDAWSCEGIPIVMTVHNGPVFDDRRAGAERRMAQGIADRASLVHLLSASTPDILDGWLRLDPARCLHIPHPNYDMVLGRPPERTVARAWLATSSGTEIVDDEIVIGLVGTLNHRKATMALLDSFESVPDPLEDGRRARLVLAGGLRGNGEELIRRAAADPRVISRFGFVRDDEMPALLASIDVAVMPYGAYLNSGWLHLALTAGIPVIAPSGGTAREIVQPAALCQYADAGSRSLADALATAGTLATPEARQAARASVEALDSRILSERFVAGLCRIMTGDRPTTDEGSTG